MLKWSRLFKTSHDTGIQPAPPSLPSFFTLRDKQGRQLTVDASSTLRLGDRQPLGQKILLCIPELDPNFGCLIAANGQPIIIDGFPVAINAVIPLRLEHAKSVGSVKCVHPLEPSRRLRQVDESGGQRLELTSCAPETALELFLERVKPDDVPVPILAQGKEIANASRLPAQWTEIFGSLRAGTLRHDLGEALLSRLPTDELQSLAQSLLSNEETRQTLRRCKCDSPWFAERFDNLLKWHDDPGRNHVHIEQVDYDKFDDLPGISDHLSHNPQLGLALHALLRRATQPRKMACVLGSARNEGAYLLEWIAYHRAVGFDHVFIYSNDNTDGSDELLNLLASAGVIDWVNGKTTSKTLPQFRAYAHALSVKPEILDYRWTLIADLDEFCGYDRSQFASLHDFLSWHEIGRADAVALPWLLHVAGRNDTWRDDPCMARFPSREATVSHHVKTIFRTNLHWSSTCHNPYSTLWLPINYRADDGRPHIAKMPENNVALAQDPRATHGWIAHYIHKSASDLLMKLYRGKGDSTTANNAEDYNNSLKTFIQLTRKCSLVTDNRTALCGQGFTEEIARLRQIPGVSACDAAIRQRYIAAMDEACLTVLRDAPGSQSEERSIFRSILLEQRQRGLFSGGGSP